MPKSCKCILNGMVFKGAMTPEERDKIRRNIKTDTCENAGEDYAECDQFVCSKCGIEIRDWHRVERDMDDGEVSYHEYTFRFCPHCGRRIVGKERERMTFKVIDNNTGKEPDLEDIALNENWAFDLIHCDMEGFAITNNGDLIMLDERGNYEFCPQGRFTVVMEGAEE